MAELSEAETLSWNGFGSATSTLDDVHMFSSDETKGRSCFKLSTEEQEGCKSCVVMVQALEEPLCNHHLTVEILSAAAALLHGVCYHHSLLKLCYPQARAQLWILVGWLKHVASPHKTRVCDFIFLPSLEQLLNNSLGKKKKCMHFI